MTALTRLLHRAGARESELRVPGDSGFSVAVQACRQARQIHEAMRNVRRSSTATSTSRLGPELIALDLGSTALTYWMLLAENRQRAGMGLLWRAGSQNPRVELLLRGLITGIVNDVLAIRTLLPLGLGQPLRSVFRNMLELGLVSVALTVDEAYFRDYLAWTDAPEGDLKAWSKVRPAVAQRVLDQSLSRSGFTDVERADFDRWRRGTYAWLSAFEHGHPVALGVTALSWNGEESAGWSVGGTVDSTVLNLADQIVWSLYEILTLFTGSLFRLHGWRGDGTAFTSEVLLSTRFFQAFALEAMASRDGPDRDRAE